MTLLRKFLFPALLSSLGVALLQPAAAQTEWPKAKPVTIIHPFAAGSDYLARLVAAALETRLGQKVIIENRAGAGGANGTAYAARQAPDGYTLVTTYPGPGANMINTMPDLPYKPFEDFVHISAISYGHMGIFARKDFPANTLRELIEYARNNPGKVSVGNNGVGSYGHMIALLVAERAGVQMKMVPYRGSPAIATDVLSGNLNISVDFIGDAYAKQVEAGAMKIIAIPSNERAPKYPNVLTFKDEGMDFVAVPWGGLMAPKGTPRPIIDKINAALADYLNSAEAKDKFGVVSQTPWPTSPGAFRDIVVREETLWREIIRKHNIKNE